MGDIFFMRLQNYIDGGFVSGVAQVGFLNPVNNSVLGVTEWGGREEMQLAIHAARRAFDAGVWSKLGPSQRAERLFKLADLIERHALELAERETLNNGKPLRESVLDVADAAACFRYYAGLVTKPSGQTFSVPDPSMVCQTVREPIGVCGQIIPWNYPLLMAAWKLAPGLAAGNCCILKPSEWTPYSVVRLFELIDEVGFPSGVAQLVHGAGDVVGAQLAASPLVDKVAFTGGGVTGRSVLRAAASNFKKVTLELGGKSPNIVFSDADFELALEGVLLGIFAGQGQVCSAGSRLLLDYRLADRFLPELESACCKIVVGDGMKKETEMGPLVTRGHMERVLAYIRAGVEEGAELLCGGDIYADERALGNFVQPTVFVKTRPTMQIVREEIFGPVLCVQLFKDEEEAVRLANNSDYGLAGGVFTQDGGKAQRVVRGLRAGVTWINCYHPTFVEAPWGGYKQSGMGRELGLYGYEAYTEVKQIVQCVIPQKSGWYRCLE
jgi:betaine-aldehyde dehydrogenase